MFAAHTTGMALTFRILFRGATPFFEARQSETKARNLGRDSNLLCLPYPDLVLLSQGA
jgi:hypothetical protein